MLLILMNKGNKSVVFLSEFVLLIPHHTQHAHTFSPQVGTKKSV